jgi:hypothetical protein
MKVITYWIWITLQSMWNGKGERSIDNPGVKGYREGTVIALDTPIYNNKPFEDEVEPFLVIRSY